ncbi:MAG: DUF6046 domain-containing protein [Bacteroidales bacterium]|jgi:hypothetical protein|nr:DUF6046 domain-containing protein [Bacteroidales bacterium]
MDPVRVVNEKTNLAMKITNALGYNTPPSFLFGKSVVLDPELNKSDYSKDRFDAKYGKNFESTLFLVPVKLRLNSESENAGFQLPLDPLISISGKNIIRRRYVAKSKMRGSIKETWSQDDYEITIAGLLQNEEQGCLNDDIITLREYLESAESIHIICDLLNNVFDIRRIAIESYDFPFTKSVENQAFTIKAYSDDNYQLLEDK